MCVIHQMGHFDVLPTLVEQMHAAGHTGSVRDYTAVMTASTRHLRRPDIALQVFNAMVDRGVAGDLVSYNMALRAVARLGDMSSALALLEAMRLAGVAPTVRCYNWALKACANVNSSNASKV